MHHIARARACHGGRVRAGARHDHRHDTDDRHGDHQHDGSDRADSSDRSDRGDRGDRSDRDARDEHDRHDDDDHHRDDRDNRDEHDSNQHAPHVYDLYHVDHVDPANDDVRNSPQPVLGPMAGLVVDVGHDHPAAESVWAGAARTQAPRLVSIPAAVCLCASPAE